MLLAATDQYGWTRNSIQALNNKERIVLRIIQLLYHQYDVYELSQVGVQMLHSQVHCLLIHNIFSNSVSWAQHTSVPFLVPRSSDDAESPALAPLSPPITAQLSQHQPIRAEICSVLWCFNVRFCSTSSSSLTLNSLTSPAEYELSMSEP